MKKVSAVLLLMAGLQTQLAIVAGGANRPRSNYN
jgi:hypothetical protein